MTWPVGRLPVGMLLRGLVVTAVLRFRSWPFLSLYGLLYRWAVMASVWRVRGVQGVVAVYLTGSLAGEAAVLGLSDVDFKIFVRGRRERGIAHEIRRRFAVLRRFFPMLGPPGEKGVYFLDDFAQDYANYPLFWHLFDDRFYEHRLLWGQDVLPGLGLKRPGGDDFHLSCLWKLKDWAERALLLLDSWALTEPQRRYLLFKAVADAGFVLLLLSDATRLRRPREEVLRDLALRLEGEDRALVGLLLEERFLLFRKGIADPEATWLLFRRLVDRCLCEMGTAELSAAGCRVQPVEGPAWLRDAAPSDAAVAVLPWRRLPLSPLDCAFFGRPFHLVTLERHLTLAEHLRLRDACRAAAAGGEAVLVRDNPWALWSVYSYLMDHWLSPARGDDLSFGLCPEAEAPGAAQLARVRERLRAWMSQLDTLLEGGELAKMDRRTYLPFLFSTMSCLILHRSLATGGFRLPGDADEVLCFLRAESPLAPGFLDRLEVEQREAASGLRPFREALFQKTALLLRRWAALERRGGSLGELEALNDVPDLESLSVSAVVVTRNRCVQLGRCLESLARQVRPPDELVVVDNGSTDATAPTVRAFRAPFPVRYVLETTPGVAAARNRGVREASGDVLAFTDDDAVAEPGWLAALENAFLRDTEIGIVGGAVLNLSTGRDDAVSRYLDLIEGL